VSEVKFLTLKHSNMKKKVPPPTESFDYELAKQKVKEQFRTGKSLYGKD